MYSNFLSRWVLSPINDCLPCAFQNSRFESCVVSIIVKFGFDMTCCEIGPVSTPISLAVQENSLIQLFLSGKSDFCVYKV